MIDLYYWTTPNGHKITMFLEEAGLPYRIIPVSIGTGEQFKPEFLAISPNNRIPAIVDNAPADGGAPVSLFESGAILLYLADKVGQFIPGDLRGRADVLQWLFWQMAGLGPMAGQNHHFGQYAPEKIPYAITRYVNETNRLYGVLNKRLAVVSLSLGSIRSRTWPAIRGRCCTSGRDRTCKTSPTLRAGWKRSKRDREPSAPTLVPKRSTPRLRSATPRRRSCLARPPQS